MTTDDLRAAKADIRKTVLAQRDALDPASRIEASITLADHIEDVPAFRSLEPGTVVSSFLPIRSEIDARPLMAKLAERGARLCVPVVVDKTTIKFRELVRGAPMVETSFGTIGPDENAAVLTPQIMLIPLAVFDRQGGRIGYGGGYYDRYVEALDDPSLIGLAFAMQEEASVPMEKHDRRLHGVLTEQGYIAV